ncbi:guanylate-binding protein 6-like [Branchiostoma floridae]|nr:guanylate-binding protein 6-like [Branchiostoma floridae]
MLEDDGKLGEGNLGLLKDLLTSLNESQLAKEVEDLERVQTDISELHEKRGFKVEELKPKEGREAVKGSSIPLILPNDRKYNASTGGVEEVPGVQRESLQVVPEALKLLEGIEEPVSVLAICGPSRTGKSYILSRLLGTADAFELGHRMDPQTFGIWMGTKVLRGKDFTIVLLDTEGIDAVGASAGQDASILVLTTLLSSHLIYNSLNVPYKGDLEKLQCFIQLAKGVTVKHGQKTKMSAFREFFPNFLWLLRDVSLKMQDKNRKDMTPTEYLITKVLRRQGDDDDIDESTSDKVGRAILSFFPSVECATLERPSGDREVMNNIAQHTDSLNPEFNEGVHDLVVTLLLKARAKRGYHKGSTVSGE